MRKTILKAVIITATILLSGCAMFYRPISPDKINYNILEKQNGVEFSYHYDILKNRGNKKMAKKEMYSGLKIVAVKITNNTDSSICIGSNYAFFTGTNIVTPLPPVIIKNAVKQSVIGYLPYFIGALGNSNVTYNGRVVSTFNFGIILWPAIAIGNMVTASTANANLLKELYKYDLTGKKINPGETVFGIIGIQDSGFIPLTFRRISPNQQK
jgi:hypothetical protein